MDPISLNKLPDFPSYKSCIKSYGRSILPPLILPSEHENLEHFRAKAIATEARLTARKQDDKKFMTLIQKLTDVFMGSKEISAADCLSVLEDDQQAVEDTASPSSSFSTSNDTTCDTKIFRTGISYEEVVDSDIGKSPNLENSNLNKKTSNDFSVESNHVVKESLSNNRSDPSCVTINVEVFGEKVQSDTECCASLLTVISKNSSGDEQESIVTSIAHSTDLEKYLDSSFDADQMSEGSVANEEKNGYRDLLSSAASDSTATLVDSSHSLTPVVQSNLENNIDDKTNFPCVFENVAQPDSKNYNVPESNRPPAENGAFVIESNDGAFSDKSKDNTVEMKRQKSWLKKVLDKAQSIPKVEVKVVSKSDGDTSTETTFRPRHVRSNSYTLDTPSPSLVLSHVGCLCQNSSETIISPHCCSLTSDTVPSGIENQKSENTELLEMQNDEHDSIQVDVNNKQSLLCIAVDKIPHQVNSECNDSRDMNVTDRTSNETISPASQTDPESSFGMELNDSGRMFAFGNQSEIPIQELYRTFQAMRMRTFDDLNAEHVKQWKDVRDDFDAQEKKFFERLTSIELNYSKSLKSPFKEFSNDIGTSVNIHQPVKSSLHSIDMPISAVRTYMANNNLTLKDWSFESKVPNLSDPCLQKKFEKVSAAVKGYLTRRLFKSDVVQSVIKSLRECARQVVEITYEAMKKGGTPSDHDMRKRQHIFSKIDMEFRDIFFNISMKDRMKIISESRKSNKCKTNQTAGSFFFGETQILKDRPAVPVNKRKLSSATIKALERKQMSVSLENKSQSIPDLYVSKKPLKSRSRTRRRILSPRSCTVSPPASWNFLKLDAPNKRNPDEGLIRVKARRSIF